MNRIVLGIAIALAAIPAAHAQQTAGEVYQWKDANGVTHYSQTPPANGRYEQRLINSAGSAAPVAQAAAAAPENAQCSAARANMAALQSAGDVQQDTDGDGKPDQVLDPTQRANQMELAQAAIKAYCTP